MRSLVTGGAGFIGSHVVDGLLSRGDEVAVVDDLSTGRRENLEPAESAGAVLHVADITERPALDVVFSSFRPQRVFHLAAQVDVRRSVADPVFDAMTNVAGTINVLECARIAQAERVVFSSTGGALYGEAETIPSPEDTPIRPMSAYGQSKHAAETYCGLYRRLHGLSTVGVRYANVYGPRQDPLGEGGVVAIYCGQVRSGERPVVFGDGRQTRDFVHVSDIVAANLAAAGGDAEGAYNIGCGQETSVLDLVAAFRELAGDDFEPIFEPPRAGEVSRSCLDPSRARRELGWEPTIGLHDGLSQTLESLQRR
ncbi:MAG: GDP-mannose 4,6-dehydratase [Solirubrobacteraceae bacterium]